MIEFLLFASVFPFFLICNDHAISDISCGYLGSVREEGEEAYGCTGAIRLSLLARIWNFGGDIIRKK